MLKFNTISKRLGAVFGFVLLLCAAVGAVGVFGTQKIAATISATANVALPHAQSASDIGMRTVNLQSSLGDYLILHTTDALEEERVLKLERELTDSVNRLGDDSILAANEKVRSTIEGALHAHDDISQYTFYFHEIEFSVEQFLDYVVVDLWDYIKQIEKSVQTFDFEAVQTDPSQTTFARWYETYEAPNQDLKQALDTYATKEAALVAFVSNTLSQDRFGVAENLRMLKDVYLQELDTAVHEAIDMAHKQFVELEQVKTTQYDIIHANLNGLISAVRSDQTAAMAAMDASVEAVVKKSHDVLLTILAALCAGVVLAALVANSTMKRIGRPLNELSMVIKSLANRDFDVTVPHKTRIDEIGDIAHSAETFLENGVAHAALQEEQRKAREHAEIERIEREAKEREAEQTALEQKRLAKEAEDAKLAEIEVAAEKERQERHAEQSLVVESLANGLKSLSTGDLSVQISQPFVASYDQLRLDFNAAVRTLSTAVETITGSALIIKDNVGELSSAANDLSVRTERSAASLEETSSALEEMTASVRSASQGAQEADTLVKSTRADSESSREIVSQAVSAMSEIDESSKKISNITSVIDDIAFQTNLLALNAGVEAARAGEAGRGFAVVASEVRSLAQRSSEAAREISALIAQSGGQVKHGVELVDKVGYALSTIVASVTEVSTHVSGIATTSSEQATGIGEINQSVTEMDQTTQQNAAMFEETTAATQSLALEAQKLSDAIAAFTIGDHTQALLEEQAEELAGDAWGEPDDAPERLAS
jgi:methyl-accepting chemotaxis protein